MTGSDVIRTAAYPRGAIRQAVRADALVPLIRGAYAPPSALTDARAYALTVMRALGADHVAIDRTAALLHGVNAYAWAEESPRSAPETCVCPTGRATKRPEVDGHRRALAVQDVVQLEGVRVTTPLRTALDIGCGLTRWHAYAAMNELAGIGAFASSDLCRELPRFRGRRGVIQLRQLAGLVEPRVESPMESRVLLAIHDEGLEPPEPQLWVRVSGEDFRLDFAYEARRVAVEYDGVGFHSSPEQRERDRRRRKLLSDAGWEVIVVTRGDLSGPRLSSWLGRLRGHLDHRITSRRW